MSTGASQITNSTQRHGVRADEQEVPPGYKRTEVGVIPEDWAIQKLESLGFEGKPPIKAGPFGSSLTKATYVSDGYKVYGQEQVIRGDHLYGDYFISRSKYLELESCAVRAGDILLSLVGTAGKLLVVPEGARPGIINPRLIRFSFDRSRVDSRFFQFLFESEQVQNRLARQAQGGTMGVLNAGNLRSFLVQLPSPTEQRAIAEALSDVDGLLGALETLIAKKRAIKQAAMQQLLTGKSRLPGFSGEWETKPFSGALERLNAKDSQIQTSEYHATGRFPVIDQGKDPVVGFSDLDDRLFECPDGGVIVFGDHTCIAKFVDFDFVIGADGTQIIRAKGGEVTRFYAYQLQHKGIEPTGYNRHFKFLREREFLVPKPDEQFAIATVLSDMDAEIAALEARRDKTRAIKQGMMQQLLTGRVRLVEPEGVA